MSFRTHGFLGSFWRHFPGSSCPEIASVPLKMEPQTEPWNPAALRKMETAQATWSGALGARIGERPLREATTLFEDITRAVEEAEAHRDLTAFANGREVGP